ncbi:MAG TPA: Crp/Fnr family transcriptional regulator [Pyrinomonadaceae bacterium]|jgi:CRP-like cAMP-binding protein
MSNTSDFRLSLKNRLLSALPERELDVLKPHLEPVKLSAADIVYQAGDEIRHVYFPDNGMISLLSVTEAGQTVEVGFTGAEGMVGLPIVLGRNEMPYQAMVQVPVTGLRADAKAVLNLFGQCGIFHDIVLRYTYVVFKQISQTCVCNHFHTIEARLCRWLTVMHDRSKNGHLSLTQEFLANMLGVQRTSIGMIANTLQTAEIIRYRRGKIEIVDYERLKQSACECFFIIRTELEEFLEDKNFPLMSDNKQT